MKEYSWNEVKEKGKTDTEEFIFLIIIDSNFRVKWPAFSAAESQKSRRTFEVKV